jgi:hypothetical protein
MRPPTADHPDAAKGRVLKPLCARQATHGLHGNERERPAIDV